MKPELFRMLKSAAEADKSKALLTLEIMSENAAGIGSVIYLGGTGKYKKIQTVCIFY